MQARPAAIRITWMLGAVALLIAVAVASIIEGRADIAPSAALREALGFETDLSNVEASIVRNLRLPRLVLGVLVGSALATAGAAYQGVFRNPLADPYLLGVAAGAGLGATLAFVNDWGDGQGFLDVVQILAFLGALAAVAMTWAMGALGQTRDTSTRLILAGVAVASFFTAVQTFLQQRNTDDIFQVYSWFLGGLNTSGWDEVLQLLPFAVVCVAVLWLAARSLDVLAVGDDEASMLGLSVGRTRAILVVVASLLTAAAVAVSGLIAFVGLIVPHAVRMMFGSSYRVVVPLSTVLGAGFLVLCDLAARTLNSGAEIPIGVVTAFFGAPFFIVILRTAATR